MEEERFIIYVDRLQEGKVEQLRESFDSAFLEVDEPDLAFSGPVELVGQVYLAGTELVFHLDLTATAIIPCKVCGDRVKSCVELNRYYEVVPRSDIKGGRFSMRDLLRQAILLEVPLVVECGGRCPERRALRHYFRQTPLPEAAPESPEAPPSPFQELHAEDYPE